VPEEHEWRKVHDDCKCCNVCYAFIFRDAREHNIAPVCPWCTPEVVLSVDSDEEDVLVTSDNTAKGYAVAYKCLSTYTTEHRIVKQRLDKVTSVFRQRSEHQPQVLLDYKENAEFSAELLLTEIELNNDYILDMCKKPIAKKNMCKLHRLLAWL